MVCLKAPNLIKKAGLAKRGAVILAFLNLCAWVPLTLAFFLSRLGIGTGWFALLWFINLVPGLLLSVQRDNWLSNLVPRGSLGRYLGQRLAIKSAFYLGAFCFLGYLLDRLGKDNLAGFTIVFTVAIAVAFLDFIIFTSMSGKNSAPAGAPEAVVAHFSLPEYFAELKEKKLDAFIVFTTFFYLTVGLSGPLYAVYMLSELHFTYLSYTMIISAEYLARVLSVPFWGRLADKSGNIRVLGIVSRIIPLIPLGWLFCHQLGYLIMVQIVSGTCWGAFDLCTQSYLYKVAPQPKKLGYIIYTRCLVLVCTAMGGLLGFFCVNSIFPTFGSRILSVFWLSAASRALVVLYMMPKLVDLAMSFGKAPRPPEVNEETLHRVLAARRGEFYRPGKVARAAVAAIQRIAGDAPADTGRPAGSRKWAPPANPAPVIPLAILVPKSLDPAVRLAHYRHALAAVPKPEAVAHHSLDRNNERLQLRYNLERQLQDLARRAETAMTYHDIGENAARLKTRYHLDRPVDAATVLAEKALAHHRIEENIERLKLRYAGVRQSAVVHAEPVPVLAHRVPGIDLPQVKSSAGLYRDKVSWARYIRESVEAILRERQPQPVPVPAGAYSAAGLPGNAPGRGLGSRNGS